MVAAKQIEHNILLRQLFKSIKGIEIETTDLEKSKGSERMWWNLWYAKEENGDGETQS